MHSTPITRSSRQGNKLHEGIGIGTGVLMDDDVCILVEDADVERSGMQIDAAILFTGLGVELH